jgi:hypothetical protein
VTDVAEAAPPDPYALYRYFDVRDILLYVGITGDLAVRDRGHISRSRWMQLTARSAVERHKTAEDVRTAEREAIETEHPLFNVQYNNTPEAKARLRAYLEESGRLDLLHPKPSSLAPIVQRRSEAATAMKREVASLDGYDPEDYVEEEQAYLARWCTMAARAWWGPWWEDRDPFAAEDLLNMICPEYGLTEAVAVGLAHRREGKDWPLTWVTHVLAWDEPCTCSISKCLGYEMRWSAHSDFTFGDGCSPVELAAQREFAEALIEAGRCSSARLGQQPVLLGFPDKTEAQFAGVVLRGDEGTMRKCTARLRGQEEPQVAAYTTIQIPQEHFHAALVALREAGLNPDPSAGWSLDDNKNRRPAA